MVTNKSLIILANLCSIFFISNAQKTKDEIYLGEYTIQINVPQDFYMLESPYEEGKYIFFIDSIGSSIFLFHGGLVKLPLVNRENAEIKEIEDNRELFSEFGKRDTLFFRETLFLNSKIRVGYDKVRNADIAKFEDIINSISIKKTEIKE